MTKLIPHMCTEGLVGYTFSCPDMIGGGDYKSFLNIETYDEELVVRSTQCHALMPMMQFSVAPWRILNEKHLDAVKKAVKTREEFIPTIMRLTKESAQDGTPIICYMEYYFPNQGYENIQDQFMLGKDILVAPVVTKSYKRNIVLPKGKWLADDGTKYEGGKTYEIEVPIDRLPYFKRLSQ